MGASDSKSRNSVMTTLLNYGYNMYEMQVEIEEGKTVVKKNSPKALNEEILIVPKTDASVLVEKGNEKEALNYEVKIDRLKLPIKKGENVGTLFLKEGKKVVSKVPLTVSCDVEKADILTLYKRNIKKILSGV